MSADPPPSDFTTTIEIPVEPLLATPASVRPGASRDVKQVEDDTNTGVNQALLGQSPHRDPFPFDRAGNDLAKLSPPEPGDFEAWRPGEIPLPAFRLAQLIGAICIGALTAVVAVLLLGSDPGHERSSGSIKLVTEQEDEAPRSRNSADSRTAAGWEESGQVSTEPLSPLSPTANAPSIELKQASSDSSERGQELVQSAEASPLPDQSDKPETPGIGNSSQVGNAPARRAHDGKSKAGSKPTAEAAKEVDIKPIIEVASGPAIEHFAEPPVADEGRSVNHEPHSTAGTGNEPDTQTVVTSPEEQVDGHTDGDSPPDHDSVANQGGQNDQAARPSDDLTEVEEPSGKATADDHQTGGQTSPSDESDGQHDMPEDEKPGDLAEDNDNAGDDTTDDDTAGDGNAADDTEDDTTGNDTTGDEEAGDDANSNISANDTPPPANADTTPAGKAKKGEAKPRVNKGRGRRPLSGDDNAKLSVKESKQPSKQRNRSTR